MYNKLWPVILIAVFSLRTIAPGKAQTVFPRNPPKALLASAALDVANNRFLGKYNISLDSFMTMLEEFSSRDREDDFEGYEVRVDTVTYYLDTSYFKDAFDIFRNRPGDCGFAPGTIFFEPLPGREAEALAFLEANHYPLHAFDSSRLPDTSASYYGDMLKAVQEKYYYISGEGEDAYYIRAISAGSFMEERALAQLRASGLFSLVAREAVPCGAYFSRLLLKREYVFGAGGPSLKSGTNFFRSYISSQLDKSVIVEIVPVSDYAYNISFTGPSAFLAIKKNNMWEKYGFKVDLQTGWGHKPDEMEIYFSFEDAEFAMGAPGVMPPLARFKSLVDESAEAFSYQNRAKTYILGLFGRMAEKYEGSKLNGF